MKTDDVATLLDYLNPDEERRLKSITVNEKGVYLEFHPPGLAMLPNGQTVAIMEDVEPLNFRGRTPLQDMGVTSFVDLFTLAALTLDEGFHFGWGTAALWLEADAGELQVFLEEGYYEFGLDIWRGTLTPAEQRLMKVALQNIVLVQPKGAISTTISTVSKSKAISEDLRGHIMARFTLGQQVAISLEAAWKAKAQDAVP